MSDDFKNRFAELTGIDHDKEIPAEERTGSAAYSMALLCKQDKEQLDLIEEMLKEVLMYFHNPR